MENLIPQIIHGDKRAFDQLYKELSPLVASTIYKVLHKYSCNAKKQDVEDLHNGLFLCLMEDDFKRLKQFRGLSTLSSYIRVITAHYVLDFLRRQKRKISIDSNDFPFPLMDRKALPDKILELTEEEKVIKNIIGTLSSSEQLLLKLCFEKGLSTGEITQIMNITEVAYYNRKSRIMKKIKKMYEKLTACTSIH